MSVDEDVLYDRAGKDLGDRRKKRLAVAVI